MWITTTAHYSVTIVTAKGNIVAELYQDTPLSDNNFITLADDGFYDGLTFHRVEPGFVIQGGDPAATAQVGRATPFLPRSSTRTPVAPSLGPAHRMTLIQNETPAAASLYIALADLPQLDGAYTVFGQVIQGLDVVDRIAVSDTIKEIEVGQAAVSQLPTPVPPTPTRPPSAPVPQAGRPLAKLPLAQRENLYTMPPAMTIDPKDLSGNDCNGKGQYRRVAQQQDRPNAVNNFVVLADSGIL